MAKKMLFISHAAQDHELVDALIELLEAGTTLKNIDQCRSSLLATGLPDGEDFATHLKTHTDASAAVILLSPNYFTNRFCLCEMGAILARSSNILPLLVSPLTAQHVQGIFAVSRLDKVESTDDLNRFVSQLQSSLELETLNLPRWSMKKKQFLSVLPSLLH